MSADDSGGPRLFEPNYDDSDEDDISFKFLSSVDDGRTIDVYDLRSADSGSRNASRSYSTFGSTPFTSFDGQSSHGVSRSFSSRGSRSFTYDEPVIYTPSRSVSSASSSSSVRILGTPSRSITSASSSPGTHILDTPQSTPVRAVRYVEPAPADRETILTLEAGRNLILVLNALAGCPHFERRHMTQQYDGGMIFTFGGYDTMETLFKVRTTRKTEFNLSHAKMMVFQILYAYICALDIRYAHNDLNDKNVIIERDAREHEYEAYGKTYVMSGINVRIVNLERSTLGAINPKEVLNVVRPILETWGGKDSEKAKYWAAVRKFDRDTGTLKEMLDHPFFDEFRIVRGADGSREERALSKVSSPFMPL